MKWTLGINIAGHGASICLLCDDKITFFLKEERVTRRKRDHFIPLLSLNYIKNYTSSLDEIYFANCNEKTKSRILLHLEKLGIKDNYQEDKDASFHHLNHASCGYYGSGFEEAICLVIDGWGRFQSISDIIEKDIEPFELYETCSIFHIKKGTFNLQKKYVNFDPHRYDTLENEYISMNQLLCDLPMDNVVINNTLDIGIVYEIITKFIGFNQDDCGKTMGLSAYGEYDSEVPPFFADDDLNVNMNLFTPSSIVNDINYPKLQRFFTFKKKCNLAFAVQRALEKKVIQIMDSIIENYECKNIVLSGGVFYNVLVNSILAKRYPDHKFYVDPLCDDSGHSYGIVMNNSKPVSYKLDNLYLGPKYDLVDLKERIYKSVSKFQNK
jgi:carbamoyltransferase